MVDLFALAEQLRESGAGQGFSDQPLSDGWNTTEFEHWDSTPVPDFYERLPDQIIDPKTGRSILISQSLIKEHRKMAMDELCPKRYRHVTMLHEFETPDSNAMAAGRRFEYELTGALDRSGAVPDELLTGKGVPSADQKRITANAELGRATLLRLGVLLEHWETQKTVTVKCLSGTYDLHQGSAFGSDIIDIKYSGLLGDAGKWSELGWYPETVGQQFSHVCQAAHYSLLDLLSGYDDVRFRFLVFDNRNNHDGEYQCFEFQLSESTMNQHKNLVLRVIEDIQARLAGDEGGFDAVPSYEKCSGCPLIDQCNSAVKWPETVLVEV